MLPLCFVSLIVIKILSSASAAPTPADGWQQTASQAPTTTTTADTPTDPPYRDQEFICRMAGCGMNLRTLQRLKDHLVEVHFADPAAINVIPGLYERGRFIYSCTECGRSFESIRAFSNHFDQSPHAAAGDLTCPHCPNRPAFVSHSASRPNSRIGALTGRIGAQPHLEHRQHLMYNHYEPRLSRGKPNNPALGEIDVHQPEPSPPRWHMDSVFIRNPRRTPFLPMINTNQITPGIASRSSVAINEMRIAAVPTRPPVMSPRQTLTAEQLAAAVRAANVRRAKAAPPCRPSELFTPEQWPSFNTNSFQTLASCSPKRRKTTTATSSGTTGEEPGKQVTESQDRDPVPIRNHDLHNRLVPDRFDGYTRPHIFGRLRQEGGGPRRSPEPPCQNSASYYSGDQQPRARPRTEEFCFVEANRQSNDYNQVVCIPTDTSAVDHSENEIVVSEDEVEIVEEIICLNSDNDDSVVMMNQGDDENHQAPAPSSTESTSSPSPTMDQPVTPWFATSTPDPGSGPQGLPMGLIPLGGLLCTWSVSTQGGPRTRRSMMIPPAPWNSTFTGNEVGTFWDLFTLKVKEALHFYATSGRVPYLVWHCSILRTAEDGRLGEQSSQPSSHQPQGYGSLHQILPVRGVEKAQSTRQGEQRGPGLL